jgi:hypothetical protein
MAIVEAQQLRMLEQLRHAAEQPMTLEQLRAAGIDFPRRRDRRTRTPWVRD